MEKEKPGYKFLSVVLIDCTFKRIENIDFSKTQTPVIKINTGFNQTKDKENEIVCAVEVIYQSFIDDIIVVDSAVKMLGVFEKVGEPTLTVNNFGKINAPSIIFPFIREHLASLSVKANIHTILLSPVNFVEMAEANASK